MINDVPYSSDKYFVGSDQTEAGFIHAELTIRTLEMRLKNRGNDFQSRGKCKWELELLHSAYNVLRTPIENRKFGLDKVKSNTDFKIKKSY